MTFCRRQYGSTMKHKLTIEQRIKGVRAALASPRPPKQSWQPLESHLRIFQAHQLWHWQIVWVGALTLQHTIWRPIHCASKTVLTDSEIAFAILPRRKNLKASDAVSTNCC